MRRLCSGYQKFWSNFSLNVILTLDHILREQIQCLARLFSHFSQLSAALPRIEFNYFLKRFAFVLLEIKAFLLEKSVDYPELTDDQ